MYSDIATQPVLDHGKLFVAVTLAPQEIGRRLAAARNQKGWTQLEFALAANVSPSSVARWEAGKLPPVRELIRLAGVLEVEPETLVETLNGSLQEERLDRLERAAEATTTSLEAMERGIEQILERLDAQGAQTSSRRRSPR